MVHAGEWQHFYNETMSNITEVCILGTGVVGQSLALGLARSGRRVTLVGSPPSVQGHSDVRAYALNLASRELLMQWNAWPEDSSVTPVEHMQVWGDDGGNVLFPARSPSPLNWIVDVPALELSLHQQLSLCAGVEWRDQAIPAQLTLICEGKHSATRSQMGVQRLRRPYGQIALATRVTSEHPHCAQASQWFNQATLNGQLGPNILALLPMGGAQGRELAVVWSLPPADSERLKAMDESDFEEALHKASHGILGALHLNAPRACWPLEWGLADHWCGRDAQGHTWALAGDAARNIHPLAGLGLNLGLGDVRVLLSHLPQLHGPNHWRPLSDLRLLRAYERQRKAECATTSWVVDGLQGLFMHPNPSLKTLRNRGLSVVNQSAGLKQWIIDRALSPL